MSKVTITDFFGISSAIKTAISVYFSVSRRSGRTTQLVEALKTGDRVIFSSGLEAKRVERLARERNIEISCLVVSPTEPHLLFEIGTSQGRTIFDHAWLEVFYSDAIERAEARINEAEGQLSGENFRHREARNKYAAIHHHWLRKGGHEL